MTAPRRRLFAAIVLTTGGLSGCGGRDAPDIVVVTLDTFRADRLGSYGDRSGLTPALDRLASRGVLFTDASCTVPLTLPSHASLFTGRYPTATGVRNNGSFVLPESEITLAETLATHGYASGAVVAAYPLKSRYGLAQGFEIYDDTLPQRRLSDDDAFAVHFSERNAGDVTARALSVWSRLAGRPRFLWVHYFDAHAPYAAPEPWGSSHAERPYDGEIAYVDAEVGRLLDSIARESPRAVVVVAADHGEGLGEHGEKTHGIFLYQSTVHVPLVIAAPGRWPAGERVQEPVTLADVVPTLLALSHATATAGLDGTDLAPAVFGRALGRREVYAESFLPRLQFRFSPLTMLRDGSLKYIDAPMVELYDLSSDPAESRNLAGASGRESTVFGRLASFIEAADRKAPARAAGVVDPDAEAGLRSLGYAASGAPIASQRGRGRDPKAMTTYLERYDRAVGLQASGRIGEGLAELRALIPEAPENYMVHYQIAAGLLADGQPQAAAVELAQVIADAPEFGNARFMLGDCLAALGRLDDAVAAYEAAAARMPSQAAPWLAKGRALEARGRFETAAAAYREAVLSEPQSTEASRALSALHGGRGDRPRAVSDLTELAARFPTSAALQAALAEAQYSAGDAASAAATLQRALALDPTRTDAQLLAAGMLLDANRPAEAAAAYRAVLAAMPEMRAAELGLGRALAMGPFGADAVAFIDGLVAKYPGDAAPHVLRGVLFERRGDAAGALAAYREALGVNPRDGDARRGIARIESLASAP